MTDEWRTDKRPENTLQIGGISRVSQTHRQTGDTAHLLTFPDGRQIRVLPDGMSGQGRSRKVRAAMEAAKTLGGVSVDVVDIYVVGYLAKSGLRWEEVGNIREVSALDWLREWFADHGIDEDWAPYVVRGLADAGWSIERAE